VIVRVAVVRVNVSPVLIVFDADNEALHRKFPAGPSAVSQNEMFVTTSPLVPAHAAHDGWLDETSCPVVAEVKAMVGRVVVEEIDVLPAVPGDAVWSWVKMLPATLNDVPVDLMVLSHPFDRKVLTPTAIPTPWVLAEGQPPW
jgi:hypothetical protein